MKQVIILLVSLGVLIFSGVWEIRYLEETSRYLISDVNYSKNAVENDNFKLARTHIDEINNTWDNMKDVWNIFVEHSEIDRIEDIIVEYKSYIEAENKEEAIVRADALSKSLSHIAKKQKIHSGNVF